MSGAGDWGTDKARGKLQSDTPGQHTKRKTEMNKTKIERFKPYSDRKYPRCVDFYIQFRGGKGDRITSPENEKDFNKAVKMIDAYCKANKIKQKPVYSTPAEGSSAFKVGLMIDKTYSKTDDYDRGVDLQPLYIELGKLKTAEDHGGGWAESVSEGLEVTTERECCSKCEGKGCDHCDGKGYHTEGGEVYIMKKGTYQRKVDGTTADKMKKDGWRLVAKEGLNEKDKIKYTKDFQKSIDARTKEFREKVAKLAYKKQKNLQAQFPKLLDISQIDNPLKGFPYNERMTKEHTEELMDLLKTANGTDMSHEELMDSMTNWMVAKGYTK